MNREKQATSKRAYYLANRERISERNREYRLREPARQAINNRLKHFLRKHGAIGPDVKEMLPILIADPCSYCGAPSESIDHISHDGGNRWENLTGSCISCNASKRQLGLLHFMLARRVAEQRDALMAEYCAITGRQSGIR